MDALSPAQRDRLFFRLQRVAHRLRKRADQAMFEGGGITVAQAAALGIIARSDGATQRHVARALDINESAVTTMVLRLEALGLVTRQRSTADSRAMVLRLTPDGTIALDKARNAFDAINAAIDAQFNDRTSAALAARLDRLWDAL
ncbi:MAG TPA: MarR family transcriptional regulator [Novosphingobium sp.]|nr:MarR family transcriptional regulator [Novosphingobium sp.]